MKPSKKLLDKIQSAPRTPGCYIYKNSDEKVLYVGKAVNLYKRLKSYFADFSRLDPKTKILVKKIRTVEFVQTDSELEALILETNLIKKYQPKYNRMMKDDKNYGWLMFTDKDDYPRIEFTREKLYKTNTYFGPYQNPSPIKRALKEIRNVFPYRSCRRKIYDYTDENGEKKTYSSNRKPCLYYHLNLCDAPCDAQIKKASYRKDISNIKRFFRSKKFKIIDTLNKKMRKASKNKDFEEAAELRDKINDLKYLAQRIKVEQYMDEKLYKEKKSKTRNKAVERLIKKIKFKNLKNKPNFRIECYDISNISGKSATGSMVVFIDGKATKNLYRKFKIKFKDTPDDFQMLKEVFIRRFKKGRKSKDKSFVAPPDLIIVDGGKGQLSSVQNILEDSMDSIPVIGLAKKYEEIYKFKKNENKFKKIKLRKGSPELYLVQRIRDEAHRFAIKYHRNLRAKQQMKSVLDTIPGVGKVIKRRLLKAFGSYENIKKASFEDLQSVVKNKKTVKNIKKIL